MRRKSGLVGEKMKKIDVAIYVRVSTNKQEANNQLDQLKEYAKKCNYHIYRIYIDIISGKETSKDYLIWYCFGISQDFQEQGHYIHYRN